MAICLLAARIEANIKRGVDYGDLEEAVGYSYHHIRDFFKKIAGISLSRYILARRIANAAFEVRHSAKNIEKISKEYGFSNVDTFKRAFQRYVDLTPYQFAKTDYLCGRRVICPGVYAPVIFGLENPMFTLQHIKEVNAMSEMKKTADSCVLYGVPKVHWEREVDGEVQHSPFPMCLQSVLSYMGQEISYCKLMVATGAVFCQRWYHEGWSYAAVDYRKIYNDPDKPFALAFKAAGRNFKLHGEDEKSKFLELIKEELDCGRPVIALGVVGPPEPGIVTGYRDNGETLLGWSLFQEDEDCGKDDSGYYTKKGWLQNAETVMAISEEINALLTDKEILENAYMLITTDEVECCDSRNDLHYGAQAAYIKWAEMLEREDYLGNMDKEGFSACQHDQEGMLESRAYAAVYVASLTNKYPNVAEQLKQCAASLQSAADCVTQIRELRFKQRFSLYFADSANRSQVAALIRKAASCEKDASVVLKEIIGEI